MVKHQKVAELVESMYLQCPQTFGQWMWQNHVPVVAQKTQELATQYDADADIAVAGAWLHDFGDAFVHRHAEDHEEISQKEAREVLQLAGYTEEEIVRVMEEVIAPHSCKDGFLPTTVEGKVMATADALAHLTTDFYVQFAWMHLPDNKTYPEFIAWVEEKIERDYNDKIFFPEVQKSVRKYYEAIQLLFVSSAKK